MPSGNSVERGPDLLGPAFRLGQVPGIAYEEIPQRSFQRAALGVIPTRRRKCLAK